jgi:hypothetical protein
MDIVALETSPVPASPLERIFRRTLIEAAQRLPQVRGAADERHRELPLVDVVGVVRRGQHLGLVDVVDAERLQHLRLDEVPDPGLGHHRDGHGVDDAVDHVGVAHAGDPALGADVGRNPLEGHDSHRAGIFGDPGLLRRDDVHNHAALQHFSHSTLDAAAAGRSCGCRIVVNGGHRKPLKIGKR